MNRIVDMALKARTLKDVDALERELRAEGARRFRYLGDRPLNWSTLSNAADPKALVFERTTNMFDSLIELEVQRQTPNVAALTSPAIAARVLFRTLKSGVADMDSREKRRLGLLAQVMLLDSDDSRRRPTIAFRDFGTGVARRAVPYTLLSLEEPNKLSKSYQHGVFGKGGSLADMFSEATVFVMRRQPDLLEPGDKDEITVAVVRREDPEDDRLPFFRYVVCDAEDARGLPWACPAEEAPEFAPGVYIAHIDYQAEKMGQENWNQDESIYAYAQTILFRPVLPFGLNDDRTPPANRRPEGRGVEIVSGLSARLEGLELKNGKDAPLLRRSAYSSVPVPGVGTARVRWWLFETRDKRRQYAAHGFVVVFTHDGQVHHTWDQQRFVTLVPARRKVAERIFVEVDLDEIPRKQRTQILSSIREALRKTPEARKLEEAIADWLEKDADLEEAEAQFVREALQKSGERMSKEFLEKLRRAISAKVPRLEVLIGRPGKGPRPKPPKPSEDLYPEPTAFEGPVGLTVVPGEQHVFFMSINAKDGFVPERGTITLVDPPADAQLTLSVGDLRRGRIQLAITAGEDAAVGTHQAGLLLSWLRASGGIGEMRRPLNVTVVTERAPAPLPTPKKKEDGSARKEGKKESVIAVVWSKLEPQKDGGWTGETVGELQQMSGAALAEHDPELYGDLRDVLGEIPTIVLSEDFAPWRRYYEGSALKSEQTMSLRKQRYAIAVGVNIANIWAHEEALVKAYKGWDERGAVGDPPAKPMDSEQRRRAATEAAKAVLVVLPDFDRMAMELEEAGAAS